MSTATVITPSQAPTADVPYDLTIDLVSRMVESGLIPQDRRVFLLDGRLYEKMAKTKAHGYVGAAIDRPSIAACRTAGASGLRARSSWTPPTPRCRTSPWSAARTRWTSPPPNATPGQDTSAC